MLEIFYFLSMIKFMNTFQRFHDQCLHYYPLRNDEKVIPCSIITGSIFQEIFRINLKFHIKTCLYCKHKDIDAFPETISDIRKNVIYLVTKLRSFLFTCPREIIVDWWELPMSHIY